MNKVMVLKNQVMQASHVVNTFNVKCGLMTCHMVLEISSFDEPTLYIPQAFTSSNVITNAQSLFQVTCCLEKVIMYPTTCLTNITS